MRDLKTDLTSIRNSSHNFVSVLQADACEWLNRAIKAEHDLEILKDLQHGRNWDDDEAERKLKMVSEEYKKQEHKLKLAHMAIWAANDNEDYYAYEPGNGVEQLRSIPWGRNVKIPIDWLVEITFDAYKEKDQTIAVLREENDSQRDSIQNLSCQVAGLREGLKRADLFITNGIEFGYIRLPDADSGDSALETPSIIKQVLASPDPGEKIMRVIEAVERTINEECRECNWSENPLCPSDCSLAKIRKTLTDLEAHEV